MVWNCRISIGKSLFVGKRKCEATPADFGRHAIFWNAESRSANPVLWEMQGNADRCECSRRGSENRSPPFSLKLVFYSGVRRVLLGDDRQ